jgi:GNAT superfamily N-acetyltransferase
MTNIGFTDRAIEAVARERLRQIGVEGFAVAHDDAHDDAVLARAAAFFAVAAALSEVQREELMLFEGRDPEVAAVLYLRPDWAPRGLQLKDRHRDLVRAGALILAEIERLDRAADAARVLQDVDGPDAPGHDGEGEGG